MYYVNQDQIDARLQFIPTIVEALLELARLKGEATLTHHFAQERALHLAIEAVTDVGSLLIDAFMMRDASSYEDIIDVLRGEEVLPGHMADALKELISGRRALTQEYMNIRREHLREDLERLAEQLEQFPVVVTAFIKKELQPFA